MTIIQFQLICEKIGDTIGCGPDCQSPQLRSKLVFSGRPVEPASTLLQTVESGRNRDVDVCHAKQWFAYCTPPDKTVNLATYQNSNRRSKAVG